MRPMRPRLPKLPLGLTLAAVVVAGCSSVTIGEGTSGSGSVKTESRSVSGFSRVALDGIGRLTVTQTGTESLSITTDDNILPNIDSTVTGDTLHLGPKSGVAIVNVARLDYRLTVKNLSAVSVSGAAAVDASGINTTSLTVSLSGAGDITVAGRADSQDVELSGAGSYKGRDFATKTATVRVSGAGSAAVAVSDHLDAHVSGVGSITYYGNPNVTQEISGVGTIKKG
jgi:Putative auto-transporter adhesin, head GIN domain